MRLPADPRRRRIIAGSALAAAVLLFLLLAVFTAGGDEDDPEQATGPTASPRPAITIESPFTTPVPPAETAAPEPSSTSAPLPAATTTSPRPPATSPANPPPTEAPQANLCAGTLQAAIDAAAPGAVLDMNDCAFQGVAKIDKPITLIGGELTSPSQDRLAITLQISADNVTIDGWTFEGGGNVISIFGKANVRILNSSFRDHSANPIMMWGGVRNIEIAGNNIVHSKSFKSSLIGGRGSEGSNPCPTVGRNVTIQNNYGDQGSGGERGTGWFGIELKCFEDVLIEGNTLRGGNALVSLPDSNRVVVRNNSLDLTGSPHWGVEIPKAHNVTVEYNTVFGDGPQSDTAFSANSGSTNMTIRYNKVSNVRTLVDDPLNSVVTDNCIIGVQNISQHGNPETSQIERNAVC